MLGSLSWTPIWRPQANETSVVEFRYERVNQSLQHFLIILTQGRSHSKIAKDKYLFKPT